MRCPCCQTLYVAEPVGRCRICGADLLPNKPFWRRVVALALGGALFSLLVSVGRSEDYNAALCWGSILLPVAWGSVIYACAPTHMADRFRLRAKSFIFNDSEQAVVDYTQALALAPQHCQWYRERAQTVHIGPV